MYTKLEFSVEFNVEMNMKLYQNSGYGLKLNDELIDCLIV